MLKHYPVISLLRRVCFSHSFVLSPSLVLSERALCLSPKLKWEKVKSPIFIELVSNSSDPMVIAQDLCKAENNIYAKAKLEGHAYSLIFGPCEGNIVRVCVIKGLWRSDGKKTISLAPS